MTCNNCLQEIVEGELFLEDEDEGTAYHVDCRQAAIDRRNKAEAENRRLAARVAELEAQLDAQQWRPVTEEWPPYNERVIIGHGGGYGGGWCVFARRVRTDNRDDWLMDDDTTLAFESAVVAMQRPLPPAHRPTGDDAVAVY